MPATAPHTAAAARSRADKRRALIEAGELVPNQPLRERLLWLLERDPEFTQTVVCQRLAMLGHPEFMRRHRRNGKYQVNADTSLLNRHLGLKPWQSSGRTRGLGALTYTSDHISYALAVALCQALEIDPVDGGV